MARAILLAVISAAVVVVASVFLFLWLAGRAEPTPFDEYLSLMDQDLERGYYRHVFHLGGLAADLAEGARDWEQILSRAGRAASGADLWDDFYRLGKTAPARLSSDVQALRAYAAARSGDYSAASEYARGLGDDYPGIQSFVALGAGTTVGGRWEALVPPPGKDEPPSDFRRAFELTGNSGWEVDGALVAAAAGTWEEARLSPATGRSNPRLTALVAYDSGNLESANVWARSIANPDDDDLLWFGDIAYELGDVARVNRLYAQVIADAPDYSPIPYLNSVVTGTATHELLRQGITLFPDQDELALRALLYGTKNGDDDLVKLALDSESAQSNPEFALLALLAKNRLVGTALQADLTELWDNHPEDEAVSEYLAWYLIGIRDTAGVLNVVSRYEDLVGPADWTRFYRGLVRSLKGDLAGAQTEWSEIRGTTVFPERWYDLAVTLYQERRYLGALDALEQGEPGFGPTDPATERILALKASALAAMDRREEAMGVLDRLFERWPGNIRGRLLYRELGGS